MVMTTDEHRPGERAGVPALLAVQLAKHYGDRPALEPLDLQVAAGEHVALVGHNGSGKTTLLRMTAGLLDPTGGEVRVMGHRAGSVAARRALSWLSDSPTFYDDLSLWEHLEYVARLHGTPDWPSRAEHVVAVLGLGARRDDLPTTFSRGLRQKASIALGLVRPCDVVLVDEPFVGLDAAGRAAFIALLDEVHRSGATVVVATHEPALLPDADRVIALRDGDMVYDGPPARFDATAEGFAADE